MITNISQITPSKINTYKQKTNNLLTGKQSIRTDSFSRINRSQVLFSGKTSKAKGFEGVAGMDDVKEEVMEEFILPLKMKINPMLNRSSNAVSAPAYGLLLYGPPGNGKSFFAKKVAEELNIDPIIVDPKDRQGEHVGQAEERLEHLFKQAENLADISSENTYEPSIMIFDEFDSTIPKLEGPNSDTAGFRQRRTHILNRLEQAASKGIFIIGTTNKKPEELDEAAVRAGRMDTKIEIPLPDEAARKQIFEMHIQDRLKPGAKFPLTSQELDWLAQDTQQKSAAEITKLCEKSARRAANHGLTLNYSLIQGILDGVKPNQNHQKKPSEEKEFRIPPRINFIPQFGCTLDNGHLLCSGDASNRSSRRGSDYFCWVSPVTGRKLAASLQKEDSGFFGFGPSAKANYYRYIRFGSRFHDYEYTIDGVRIYEQK